MRSRCRPRRCGLGVPGLTGRAGAAAVVGGLSRQRWQAVRLGASPRPGARSTGTPYGADPRTSARCSAAGRSKRRAPDSLPRIAWVSPTASCASPRQSSRSAPWVCFHTASRTSWASNGRPASSNRWAVSRAWSRGAAPARRTARNRRRLARVGGPGQSRDRALRGRPAGSRSRSRPRRHAGPHQRISSPVTASGASSGGSARRRRAGAIRSPPDVLSGSLSGRGSTQRSSAPCSCRVGA